MSFNASDPSGAGGVAGDVATIAAMGAHALPVITASLMRDTAEVFDQHADRRRRDRRAGAQRARRRHDRGLEGRLPRHAEGVSAVAEILSDYPDVPLVAYLPNLAWVEEDEQQAYLEAFRELVLPQTEVLVGNHKTLTDFLLPDWDADRPASARELAVAAAEHGTRFVLVTGIAAARPVPRQRAGVAAGRDHRREVRALRDHLRRRRRHALGGAGRAARRRRRAARRGRRGARLPRPGLDAGFRPGMGNVVPDRFFWALARRGEEDGEPGDDVATAAEPTPAPHARTRAMSTDAATRRPGRSMTTNDELFERAQRVIPGGVNSPVRAFRAVGGTPRFIARGEGAVHVRRRGPALHRLHRLVGADDPRPRPPGRARGGARSGRATACRSARRPSARSSSPRRSSRWCRASSRCAWSARAPRRR